MKSASDLLWRIGSFEQSDSERAGNEDNNGRFRPIILMLISQCKDAQLCNNYQTYMTVQQQQCSCIFKNEN